jgi:hypothetical protein
VPKLLVAVKTKPTERQNGAAGGSSDQSWSIARSSHSASGRRPWASLMRYPARA